MNTPDDRRAAAIRLLQAVIAAGARCDVPTANDWIQKTALERASLDGEELDAAVVYAAEQEWIERALMPGYTSLTEAGQSVAISRQGPKARSGPTT